MHSQKSAELRTARTTAYQPTYLALAARLHALSRATDAAVVEFAALDLQLIADLAPVTSMLVELAERADAARHRDPLTPAQMRVMAFLRTFLAKHGHPPTRKEIADALGFKSANGAHEHLKALARRGAITLSEGEARGIRINKRGSNAANTTARVTP